MADTTKRLLTRLDEEKAKLTAIVEYAGDAIITVNEVGIIQSFNAAAISMFGYSATEVQGKKINHLIATTKENHEDLVIGKITVTTAKRKMMTEKQTDNSFPIQVMVSKIMLTNQQKFFTYIIRDITEQKEKEHALYLSTQEAKKANAAKTEFLSSMSHELRTPLNAVLGFAQLLASDDEKPLDEEHADYVEEIMTAGEHLLSLVNDVLDLSKIEMGETDIKFEAVDTQKIILEVITLTEHQAKQRSITIKNEMAEIKMPKIIADYKRVKQVLLNFASNAVKYNKEHGLITFSCEKTNHNKIRIYVSDTGKGVTEDLFPALFEPFNRLGNANSNIQGTGIGLSICKNLIELMHGEIGVFRNTSKGLTFWIEFKQAS